MSLESYAHKAAKQVVVSWLREAANSPEDYVTACGCRWRVNRGPPYYGVWEEYPILSDFTGINPVWDEVSIDEPTRVQEGNVTYYSCGPTFQEPPSFDYLKTAGKPPLAILDVAIQHKGHVVIGIEIVHKNPPHAEKLKFLHKADLFSLLVLPARWVLGQVAPPRHVPPEFWAWSDSYFRPRS